MKIGKSKNGLWVSKKGYRIDENNEKQNVKPTVSNVVSSSV